MGHRPRARLQEGARISVDHDSYVRTARPELRLKSPRTRSEVLDRHASKKKVPTPAPMKPLDR